MKSKFQGHALSASQMKNIKGGNPPAGVCAAEGTVCYTQGGIEYKCFTTWDGGDNYECCCGHDAGNMDCHID